MSTADITNNAILQNICLALSKAEIYRRYASNDIPADVAKQEEKAYKDLEKIQHRQLKIDNGGTTIGDGKFEVKQRVFK